AKIDDVSSALTATVYRSTEAHIEKRGELTQNKNYTPVVFIAREEIDTRNPASVYEWTVNGVVASNAMVYEFIPSSAGEYRISLAVNGKTRKYGEDNYALVSVAGERAPVGTVEFDDVNGVIVTWRDKQSISSVSITSPDGVRRTFSRADLSHAYRFHLSYFDADGLIEVCAEQPKQYTLRLTADGQGDEFTFTQLPIGAKLYLESKVLCRNTFISSEFDAEMWIRELYSRGESNGVGYSFGLTKEELTAVVNKVSSDIGLSSTVSIDGDIVSVNLGEYVNAPIVPVSAESRYIYSELPHIEYDRSNLRYKTDKSSYKLYIERLPSSVAVHNSEQLLIAAMSGVKPTFTSGSGTEATFLQAKDILLSVIGYGYDDFDKVHAIYDWMQFLTRKTDSDPTKTCDYIEAYFAGKTALPEGYNYGAASSKGAAKTFALLCAMEGIPCEIVSYEKGGKTYYRNAVIIDGAYYNLDVYGGKSLIEGVEIASHLGLFTVDGVAESVGAFDRSKTYYTKKSVYDGAMYDRYLTPEETSYSHIKTVVFGAFDSSRIGEVTIPIVGSTVTVAVSTYAAEIIIDPELYDGSALQTITDNIEKAIKEYLAARGAGENSMIYKIHNNGSLHLIASVPIAAPTE
ncbi:MAG: hypothetical protein J1F39_00420, partial [Clostridiales bacterium]|nr:hypothetical protein [Clostridiales bacterium]